MNEETISIMQQLSEQEQAELAQVARLFASGQKERARLLIKIAKLPEPAATVARLRLIDGLSMQEIAQRTNYTVRWCYKLLQQAKV